MKLSKRLNWATFDENHGVAANLIELRQQPVAISGNGSTPGFDHIGQLPGHLRSFNYQ